LSLPALTSGGLFFSVSGALPWLRSKEVEKGKEGMKSGIVIGEAGKGFKQVTENLYK